MLRFELVVGAGEFFETFDSLGVERILEFSGRVLAPQERFDEIQNFHLAIQVKNSRSDILGSGELDVASKVLKAEVFLTQADVQNLMQLLPSLSAGHLDLSFFLLIDNSHEIFDDRKGLKDRYEFHIDEFVKVLGYNNT
ncbi:hypothetical protein [Hydrogenovibrio marinus]|uniref:Uncharacterized protein n=1 Tax=Hydrogenovibrio marinus TaxID=28885 RepID=A0A066ZZ39_HYDMR|nr:hypothetical protein [Hydrogenovibrio marinus]KDN95611.1 hypothetical protein EI16_04735 [Hydrogenovibrio marinus]BBN60107.1 hypothetical protein HVMH_1701 [Hydrogenovibrio marinus]